MADFETLQLEFDRGCATVWLNRPDKHNAFHEGVIAELASIETINPAALQYANRLSDHLFVLSRVLNDNGAGDVLWKPGANGARR